MSLLYWQEGGDLKAAPWETSRRARAQSTEKSCLRSHRKPLWSLVPAGLFFFFSLLNHTAALKNPGKTKLFFSRVLNMEGGLELILFIFFILVMRKMRPREMWLLQGWTMLRSQLVYKIPGVSLQKCTMGEHSLLGTSLGKLRCLCAKAKMSFFQVDTEPCRARGLDGWNGTDLRSWSLIWDALTAYYTKWLCTVFPVHLKQIWMENMTKWGSQLSIR